MSFQRIAIVNRGEPAMRLIHAVRDRNEAEGSSLRTIALYTTPDRNAAYVRHAHDAYDLGPAVYVDETGGRKVGYLDYARLEEALVATGAEAAWVGWGFVAEHAEFADLCKRLGVVFIGPDADVMRRLGDKITSKQIAESAGVPVAPWTGEPVETAAEARRCAEKLGYPVMIKATAGGGGRGIRVVRAPNELEHAFGEAVAEAATAFGDPTVFMESMIEGVRHIEVQIVGDRAGNIWPVGVRDCTVQRRNQKVVEEAPSPALRPEEDAEVRAAAARLARAAGYRNAGTVEFLFDPVARQFWFLEVNARLQVEHPITEMTTGTDLVQLQIHVADGGLLDGEPPPTVGHAIEARLNAEDTERGFVPAPGAIDLFRLPTGPGIRVDTGVEENDAVAAEYDSMIAKIIAWGADRNQARARLSRALAEMGVVIRNGTTNKSLLRWILEHPDFRASAIDVGWLDRAMRADTGDDDVAAIAIVASAVAAHDEATKLAVDRFMDTAARGRPDVDESVGRAVKLRYRGHHYELTVYGTGPNAYRINAEGHDIDVVLDRQSRWHHRLTCNGATYRVLSAVQGIHYVVEIDGTTYRVERDEGGTVRAPSPAVVVSMAVVPGDRVEVGDRLAVIEAMKMETSVTADFAGTVRAVHVRENQQVGTGDVLLVIDPDAAAALGAAGKAVDLRALGSPADGHDRCVHWLQALHNFVLGYDVDHAALMVAPPNEARPCRLTPEHEKRDALERSILRAFVDISALSRRQPTEDESADEVRRSRAAYLRDYLRNPSAQAAGLPVRFVDQLRATLRHYGVDHLDPSPELRTALYRIAVSQSRLGSRTGGICSLLDDRLDRVHVAGGDDRELLDQLASESRNRYPAVHDLAQEVRYRTFDLPFLEEVQRRTYGAVERMVESLESDPEGPGRATAIDELVDCPQPLSSMLSRRFATASVPARRALLEVMTRRYYRIRDLSNLTLTEAGSWPCVEVGYEFEGSQIRVLTTHTAFDELEACTSAIASRCDAAQRVGDVVADLYVWRAEPGAGGAQLRNEVAAILDRTLGTLQLRRITVAVSDPLATTTGMSGVHHITYRPAGDGRYREDRLYRDMHPMMGKRLELWRLENFSLRRLPTTEDIYLFHGVAADNPDDERLFLLAEVRDLTPITDESGAIVGFPDAERMIRDSFGSIRRFQAARPQHRRLLWNRMLLYIWPTLDISPEVMADMVGRITVGAGGLGLQKITFRARMPAGGDGGVEPVVIEITDPSGYDTRVRLRKIKDRPIRTLRRYTQDVVRLRRRGLEHPFEILRMLAPSPGDAAPQRFPPGEFIEYEMEDGRLTPIDRGRGHNDANVVVGVIKTFTARYPEGIQRVVLVGDPTRGMGNLGEPECTRIIAALDLAESKGIPVEWIAVSAGALISMTSGTENMDWVAAVLRRLVEFTQAGGEVNVIVAGINVGAQPYWNAEATMLMHTKGILVMTPQSAMVLTGKKALDYSGSVSAEDNQGIGGYERIMGPNGQAQYFAADLAEAGEILLRHYQHSYVAPGERFPRPAETTDPADRNVEDSPHGGDFATLGEVFSEATNPDRKRPFEIRKVMAAVVDADHPHLERWFAMRDAEVAVVWDAHLGGQPVALLGFESKPLPRSGFLPEDGPDHWTSGTLFPAASKKIARAINAASGSRPLVVVANLSGFDGSPESMRMLQLEYGAEIGRAVVNFDGPIVFCVVSRYHGGAFVVFSKTLHDNMEVAALEGAKASVIGGAPAAAVVFARDVDERTKRDERVAAADAHLADSVDGAEKSRLRERRDQVWQEVRAEKLGEVAAEFDATHNVHRALQVGSIDRIIPAAELRPYLIDAVRRGMRRTLSGSSP